MIGLLLLFCGLDCFAAQPDFSSIDRLVNAGIANHKLPGAVVIVGHNGHIVYRRAYGSRSLIPAQERMTANTIFDMASLTKCLATATAVMQLYQQGRISVDEPVAHYLPEFAQNGKQNITVRNLLTHYSGLPPDLPLTEPWEGKSEAYRMAFAINPSTPPGVRFVYSDIDFIVLGALVEKITGQTLDEYAAEHIYKPLGMSHTRFLPPVEWRPLIAPTQYEQGDHGTMLRGVVHDPTSRRMGGVAGHAGLFSTADDVSLFAQALLDRLAGRPSTFPLSRAVLAKMVIPEQPATATALRGFGWDIDSPFSSNRGTIFPVGSFGHTGFTGTSLWMDPVSNTYVVMLANAVHPDGPKGLGTLRGDVADSAAIALGIRPDSGKLSARLTGYNESIAGMRHWPARNGEVKTGIDVLASDGFAELTSLRRNHPGQLRIGLLTNQSGVDSSGRRTIDLLAHAPNVELKTLFSPEHGIHGTLDRENIGNSKDETTGIPVISLYGATDKQRRPSLDMLRQLDAIVIDLQDSGVRFYTYETVMDYFLEAASQTGTPIVVLDRPDPLNGAVVQGPVSDADDLSYVHYLPLPVRHGMTMGELARYFVQQRGLHTPLKVVAMQGWQRGDWYDSTALTWVNPSPNLRNMNEATLYPALGLVESTNISVGRGTDTPFELLGAPWINGRLLAAKLNAEFIPGVRFVPADFTPAKPAPYGDELCHGIQLIVTNRNVLDSPRLGVEIAALLRRLYPDKFLLNKMKTLLANRSVLEELQRGESANTIMEQERPSLEHFLEQRQRVLLYP